jgi:hypothetical protein
VCGADQCIGPDPEFGDSSIPAGNCGPVSSDILERRVRILYELMFYIKIVDFESGAAMRVAIRFQEGRRGGWTPTANTIKFPTIDSSA